MTAFQAEGCGGGFAADYKKGGAASAAGCVEGLWKKVLKIDRPFRAGGFLSLTALRAEGCGIALRAMSFIMPPVGGKTVKPRLRHRSGNLLESPFMCRPGTNFARLGDPLQRVSTWEMHPFCRLRRRLPRRGRF